MPPIDSHSVVNVILGTGNSTRTELTIGTEPRLMTLYGQPSQVSTVQGTIQADEGGRLWKLLIGDVEQSGYTGPQYPNRTTNTCCFSAVLQGGPGRVPPGGCPKDDPCPYMGVTNCSSGCLYEVRSDPSETRELSSSHPEKVQSLLRRIEELRESAFLPIRCRSCDDGFGGIFCRSCGEDPKMCDAVENRWGGFYGPWVL